MSKRRKQFLARLLTFLALALRSAAISNGSAFTYDAENHLTGMSVSGTTISIVYDAFGNRVSKTVNGVTTKYLVEDDVNPTGYPQVMDEIVSGSVERTYTYGLQRISQDQLISSAWTPSFYGYDGAGTVRQLTNSAGAITDTYDYDAFGNEVNHTGTTPNNYLYRAEQYDPDLGLYYLRARYMNPVTGRFMSRDPLDGAPTNPASLHRYSYANSDPVDLADPSGNAAGAGVLPGRVGVGGALGEYVVLTLQATAATVAVATVGCAVNTAYYFLAARFNGDVDITKDECEAKGRARMHIQVQYRDGTTVEIPLHLSNDDPPGVTKQQVGLRLADLYQISQLGGLYPPVPKSIVGEIPYAIYQVMDCVGRWVAGGGTGPTWVPKNICQGFLGNSGWRIDLDSDAGWNLRQ
jgi:RHS repeat-associated protein